MSFSSSILPFAKNGKGFSQVDSVVTYSRFQHTDRGTYSFTEKNSNELISSFELTLSKLHEKSNTTSYGTLIGDHFRSMFSTGTGADGATLLRQTPH